VVLAGLYQHRRTASQRRIPSICLENNRDSPTTGSSGRKIWRSDERQYFPPQFSVVIAALGAVAFATVTMAHHSTTMFDCRDRRMKGTVKNADGPIRTPGRS
jgi:hypothetical protein